jgi:cytochrome b6-f complex iron-sulfur subunit
LIGGGAAVVALAAVVFASFAWPGGSDVDAPSPLIDAGDVNEFVVGEPVRNSDERFHVVKLESGGFLALYMKDPHLGCSVPWAADFEFQGQTGWFRNPCHSETYTITGHCVLGPCPRGLDRFPVEIRDDRVLVDTSRLICGPGAPEGMVCLP